MKDWEPLLDKYRQLKLEESDDFNKQKHHQITYNSTAIEGSTLSLQETIGLLENGHTYGGKPLIHYLMVRDHYEALKCVPNSSDLKVPITVDYFQKINALVMAGTGPVYNTPLEKVKLAQENSEKEMCMQGTLILSVMTRWFHKSNILPRG